MFGNNPIAPNINRQDGSVLHVVKGSPFSTIQGEGPHAGKRATFVRLHGCNLRCTFSFGWFAHKGRQPYITMANGLRKRLGKIKAGEKLLTLNKDGRLEETEVKKVTRYKVVEWISAKIGRYTYYMTPEHPLFTNRGLVEAANLRVGDEILHTTPSDVNAYKKLGARNPNWNPSSLRFNFFALKREVKAGKHICERCGALRGKRGWSLEVHHRDHNKTNDTRSNLEVVCKSCHSIEHKMWKNAPGFQKGHKYYPPGSAIRNGIPVTKIKHIKVNSSYPKKLPIVSLTCGPNPTYLADLMWHHNCDTQFSDPDDPLIALADLLADIWSKPAGLVVITGGEPLRQNILPLCHRLWLQGYTVQIETAGTLWIEGLEHYTELVVSPKTPTIHPKAYEHATAFKYVVGMDMEFCGFVPITATQKGGEPRALADPPPNIPVYLSPMDVGDEEKNKMNRKLAAALAMANPGTIAGLQLHKFMELD